MAVPPRHSLLTALFGPPRSPERALKIGGTAFTLCGILCLGSAFDLLVSGSRPATSLFCGSIGLLFLGAGSGFLLMPLLPKRKRQWIRMAGTPVKARVIEIRHDRTFGLQTTWDDWSPWVIAAEAEEGLGKKATFTSHYLWVNPQLFFPVGSEVTVYRHPGKPTDYAFEFEQLPETV
jgi:hypothetical protein